MSDYTHLEPLCAHFGSRIVAADGVDSSRLQTIVRNALGVMREEGLFAFYLYLRYRWEDGGKVIWPQIRGLWREEAVGPLLGGGDDREAVI
ncbi:MAG TPA: hypothetical protein ENJ31_00095, partial [Anaerolineae bacterium]|nr:hypothetical protein [Anaerolineae bacterium]